MAYRKRRTCTRWRHTALSVGFLTIILVASAHAQSAEYILWSNDKIRRANIDGSGPIDVIVDGGATGFALDPFSEMIYWVDGTSIFRANMDGTGTETLRNDVTPSRDFALDLSNNHMYWIETNCCIRRANLDGTGVTIIVNPFNGARGMALDVPNNHVYWVDGNDSTIERNDLDGVNKNRITLIDDSGLHAPSNAGGQGIALDVPNNKMYWVEQSAGGKIRRANLDGTGAEVLITGMTGGIGIALDLNREHIYWGDWSSVPRAISRANLDGTDAQSWITITGHHGIVLQYVSSSSGRAVRYVPFKSQYVVLGLFALLGCWFTLRPY